MVAFRVADENVCHGRAPDSSSGVAIEKTSALPWPSWTSEESQVESCEHQDNANIHYQSFPESVSEEHEIYADYNGCHRHHVEHYSYPSVHFSTTSFHFLRSGRVNER